MAAVEGGRGTGFLTAAMGGGDGEGADVLVRKVAGRRELIARLTGGGIPPRARLVEGREPIGRLTDGV